jgi:hypothetical protein
MLANAGSLVGAARVIEKNGPVIVLLPHCYGQNRRSPLLLTSEIREATELVFDWSKKLWRLPASRSGIVRVRDVSLTTQTTISIVYFTATSRILISLAINAATAVVQVDLVARYKMLAAHPNQGRRSCRRSSSEV